MSDDKRQSLANALPALHTVRSERSDAGEFYRETAVKNREYSAALRCDVHAGCAMLTGSDARQRHSM